MVVMTRSTRRLAVSPKHHRTRFAIAFQTPESDRIMGQNLCDLCRSYRVAQDVLGVRRVPIELHAVTTAYIHPQRESSW